VSLVARHLEENGIATVVVGTARDIVENCGVARFLFNDAPLGSPCGEPDNPNMQREIVGMALDLLESASEARTTVQTPYEWSKGDAWKAKILTPEQPWQTKEANEAWMAQKELYRKLRKEGKV
jgi:hypothetical protein